MPNLIGVDPDYRIHLSDELFAKNDGPMLEEGIKAMRGKCCSELENHCGSCVAMNGLVLLAEM